MITIIASILGIAATVLAWNLNPRRKMYAELDAIYKSLEGLYAKRDRALAENNVDALTVVNAQLLKLSNRKTVLLQRLG